MNVSRLFALAGSLAVIMVVLAGLYLGGSPSEQRLFRLDERRVDDLRRLARVIEAYWDKTQRLPQELEELVDGQRLGSMPLDPLSRTTYIFEPIALNAYRLCAEFSRSSRNPEPKDFWGHKAGYQCFDFKLVQSDQ